MKPVLALLAVALLAGGVVFLAMGGFGETSSNSTEEPGALSTEKDFRDKVAELRRDRQKLAQAILRLEEQKDETVQYLKDKGVTSSADITGDKDVTYALHNLKGWKTEIAKLSGQAAKYDESIQSLLAMLDKLNRDQISDSVALSDEQLVDLRRIVVDLDDRLNIDDNDILLDEEFGQMLDEEMNSGAEKKE